MGASEPLLALGIAIIVPAWVVGVFYYFRISFWRKHGSRHHSRHTGDEESGVEAGAKAELPCLEMAKPEMDGTPVCEVQSGQLQEAAGREVWELDGVPKFELDARPRSGGSAKGGGIKGSYMGMMG